jgi:hypothetical protein
MGGDRARLLIAAGVDGVADLGRADPDVLHRRLVELAGRGEGPAPRPELVRLWIRAADPGGRPRR